jgi:hypothetical protein
MAIAKTTTSAAVLLSDTSISVTSATSFVAGGYVQIDSETMQVTKSYVSGTTIPVRRGVDGTASAAHVSGATATFALPTDLVGPMPQTAVQYPFVKGRQSQAYAAAGAITLPTPGNDMTAMIMGTSALAMTVAAPTGDLDGSILYVVGAGKSASTVTFTGGIGLGGTSYDVITFQNAAAVGISAMAVNGAWVLLNGPITGTTTGISVAVA